MEFKKKKTVHVPHSPIFLTLLQAGNNMGVFDADNFVLALIDKEYPTWL